jgi:hypothetical protein
MIWAALLAFGLSRHANRAAHRPLSAAKPALITR